MDYSTITAAVSFSDVLLGIATIGASVAALLVARRGVGILLGAIKGK